MQDKEILPTNNPFRILARVAKILTALLLVAIIFNLWQLQQRQSLEQLDQQSKQLADQMVQLAAIAAAPAMAKQDDEQLDWLMMQLNLDPRVLSASAFDDKGRRISQAQSLFPENMQPEDDELQQALSRFEPFIASVDYQQKNIGFIRLRMNTQLFFKDSRQLDREQQKQQPLLFVLAGFVGFLLTRALSLKRAKQSALKRQQKKQA
ncbi:AhpA/YtjB family protein [Ferrimonas aestuarii]|uniref:AhpA/YtjB family protein n=1 Tax=Ferrimonas aestuarii TaxID=2569539 RepID=UPI00145DEE74|nr:AhpA/YtjB family protein [Ferrimonas aestuarii]